MIKIPQNNRWTQTNRSDILGSLWSSFNVDLQSNVGTLRNAPRLKLSTSSADDADLGVPAAFKHFNDKIWAICGAHIFTNAGEPDDSFTDDATTGFQTDYSADESDLEIFNGVLCATTTDALYSTDGTNWTSRDTLSTGAPHMLTYFKKFDRLYYSNLADNIQSIDSAWNPADPGTAYAISLSSASNSYFITCLKASSTRVWIGVIDRIDPSRGGKVIEWDGISSDITNEYVIPGGVMSMIIDPKRDTPIVMGGLGILYAFGGAGFVEIGRLPFAGTVPFFINDADNSDRFMHPNGMAYTPDGTILVLVNNRPTVSANNVPENLPSGIWEFDENNGFVHKHSFSYNPVGSSTITDFGQNRVAKVGAISIMRLSDTTDYDGHLLAGAQVYTDATSTKTAIFIDNSLDTIQKNGYFVTSKILSNSIVDSWGKFYLRFKKLLNSTDKIVVKYRTKETTAVESSITWVNTTSFTVTAANVPDLAVGDEVEIIQGDGSGKCAHVVSFTGTTTYTVTVDETFTGATTNTAKARFQKWTKLFSETSQAKDYLTVNMDPIRTSWVQFKVFMQFTGKDEVYDIKLDNKSVV